MAPRPVALVLALLCGLCCLGLGCKRAAPGSGAGPSSSSSYTLPTVPAGHHVAHYAAKGVVKAIAEAKTSVKIDHEDIPGFMKAMAMAFPVSDPRLLEGIAVGDAVDFSFAYDEDDTRMWIESIKKR